MLSFGIATFGSMLLAIALRGGAVRLFLFMLGAFVLYLAYAILIGAAELRRTQDARFQYGSPYEERAVEEEPLVRFEPLMLEESWDDEGLVDDRGAAASVRDDQAGVFAEPILAEDVDDRWSEDAETEDDRTLVAQADHDELWLDDDRDRFGSAGVDDDFFRPIPELQASAESDLVWGEGVNPFADLVDEVDTGDPVVEPEVLDDFFDQEPVAEESMVEPEPEIEADPDSATRAEPTFTAPLTPRPRPSHRKARPIYIESQLDEGDDPRRVVND